MTYRRKTSTGLMALCVLALCATALAQGPPPDGMGGPPPQFGGHGQFGGGHGGFGGHGGAPATAANVPAEALASGLSLTADQQAKVKAIQQAFQEQRRALKPAPGAGGPPDPSTFDAMRSKMQALDKKASADVTAVLTSSQKAALPGLLSEIDSLRPAGIPPELVGSLKLTADQKTQLAAIDKDAQAQGPMGRRAAHDKAQAVLTDAQKAQIEAFRQAHPRPQFGGGGPGGPGGGPDGGPPPGDGNGPPPGQ